MTALAAALFIIGALASIAVLARTWRDHGRTVLALRGAMRGCPDVLDIVWTVSERPHPGTLPTGHRASAMLRPRRRAAMATPVSLPLAA